VRFPQDEAPHDVLAEWWYYTGHLYTDSIPEEEFGFEFVFFRGIRGDRPPGYAAHFAVTDVARERFAYDQRQDVALNEAARPAEPSTIGQTVQPRPAGHVALVAASGGFDLALGDWWMRGLAGRDTLRATMAADNAPRYALDLGLSATRAPALHQGVPPLQPGLISFGPAGYSYYYSRTRMDARGTLTVDGMPRQVHGEAWMDHQWGDFLVLGGGGWDWFAANLDDGRDLTFSIIRDDLGRTIIAYGTLVTANGDAVHLPPGSFEIEALDTWSSPRTGVTYPSGWRLRVPDHGLDVTADPLLRDQELDTRRSTGVVYWEGAVAIRDSGTSTERGKALGRGYVELTGYK